MTFKAVPAGPATTGPDQDAIRVYWLEQTGADVPDDETWLSPGEVLFLRGIGFAKRRADWKLGRWTAKRAVAAYLGADCKSRALAEIELRPSPSGAPELFVSSDPARVSVSISHRAGVAICALASQAACLGCDLELLEPRSDGFISDYFTPAEQAVIRGAAEPDRSAVAALFWSAKESALKALREGLRQDTRSLTVRVDWPAEHEPTAGISGLNGWNRLEVRAARAAGFHGWWRKAGRFVRTLVADPEPLRPLPL